MINQEIAKIFNNIAIYLEMDDISFKPQAYEKAAITLESLAEDVERIYDKKGIKGLDELPGIGASMAEKIAEYIRTGKIKEYERLKKSLPIELDELISVEGLGPKKIKALYKKLKIKNLKDLEEAGLSHKIASLPGFGEKTEKNILEGIKFVKRGHGRFLLGEIFLTLKDIYEKLKSLKEVERIDYAGSIRRMKETIGDVDFLVISNKPSKVMDFFVKLPEVAKVWARGGTKASVRMKDGFDMDIRVIPPKSYGAALQYFTGSKEHNIALRKIAIDKGLKLSEYGLFQGNKIVAAKTEEEVYAKLGLEFIPPEMRENTGEIELSQKNKLPELIKLKDIKGDLHAHSDWNGGENSIEEMAQAAISAGYEYIGIADHTKFLRIENGLDEKQLEQRNKEIDKLNKNFAKKNFRILKGCEANIMEDGSIDIKDEALAKLDFVIAGIHSQFKMPKEKMTKRIIKAMKNKHVDIISHPTGRILKHRDEFEVDFSQILKAAKKTGTILEINAHPYRLDLKDTNIRKAKEAGVKMIINSDAHEKAHLYLMEYGVAQARRGWAEKKDIVNAWPLEKFLQAMKKD